MTPEEVQAKKQSDETDKEVLADATAANKVLKLLLLGAGESGKSTFFKQAITLYGQGHSPDDRKQYIPAIISNIMASMLTLLKFSTLLKPPCPVAEENEILAERLLEDLESFDISQQLNMNIAPALAEMWSDPGLIATYDRRSEFQLPDSFAYFMTRVHEVMTEEYVPSVEDILRVRSRTTGITETRFLVKNRQFAMYDVGGQRTERRKWINCFENVTAVLFVVAISEYNQKLFEDEAVNRMSEALTLFEEIVNSEYFVSSSMILFLNKKDLFEAKIRKVPLTVCPDFAEYKGPQEYAECAQFITQQFHNKQFDQDKKIYTHITTATDIDNARKTFDTVTYIFLTNTARKSGLL